MGPDVMILVFLTFSFKPAFSLSSFTLIKRLFSSSSLSALRVISSVYLKLLIFLPAILTPAGNSSSLVAFLMISSAYKVNSRVTINSLLYSFLSPEPVRSVHISPPSGTSFPPTLSNPLGCYRAWGWAPCIIQQLPTSCLFTCSNISISMLLSQFIPPSLFWLCSQACSLCLHLFLPWK